MILRGTAMTTVIASHDALAWAISLCFFAFTVLPFVFCFRFDGIFNLDLFTSISGTA